MSKGTLLWFTVFAVFAIDSALFQPAFLHSEDQLSRYSNEWVVELTEGLTEDDIDNLAFSLGFFNKGKIIEGKLFYRFEHQDIPKVSSKRSNSELSKIADTTKSLSSHSQIISSEHQKLQWRASRYTLPDPLFGDQWHLLNTGQTNASVKIDVSIVNAWEQGYFGQGVVVCIVDDGLQYTHPDLSDQYIPEGSRNFVEDNTGNETDPQPNLDWDFHGTSCAGVATARNNSACGVGSAYQAGLTGIRLLGMEGWTDAVEAIALSYKNQLNDIYSNSWGPYDDGRRLDGPRSLALMAIENSIQQGRGGKGSIYIWAAGNGLESLDNCNYDGYANLPYTIAVGAIANDGKQSYYSEPCAAMLVTAPSNGGTAGITTTDLLGDDGYSSNDCTADFGGTSSATPLVAGIVALILEANPELGWQDVQHILVNTANVVDINDPDWSVNGAGYYVNHKYGFGLINASAAVTAAKDWVPVARNLTSFSTKLLIVDEDIPSYNGAPQSIKKTVQIDTDEYLSHVAVVLTTNHTSASDLQIVLTSPSGTQSILAEMNGYYVIPTLNILNSTLNNTFLGNTAQFGPALDGSTTYLGELAVADPIEGCVAYTNTSEYDGKILLVQRGNCSYTEKVKFAQEAGAVAVVVFNSVTGPAPPMGGSDPSIIIPSFIIRLEEGEYLKTIVSDTAGLITVEMSGTKIKDTSFSLDYVDWAFSSVRNWGESSKGTWTLEIFDMWESTNSTGASAGKWESWQLVLYKGIKRETSSSSGPNSSSSSSSSDDFNVAWIIVPVVIGALVLFVLAVVIGYVILKWWRRRVYTIIGD